MTRRAMYPSVEIQPIPPFTFEVPEEWEIQEVPGAHVAIHPSEQTGDFWVNVLVASSRVTKQTRMRDVSMANFIRLKRRHPDAEISSQKAGRFGERPTYMRVLGFTDNASGKPLAQVQGLFFGPSADDRDVVDLFSVVGTAPADQIEHFGPIFVKIISSFDFPSEI